MITFVELERSDEAFFRTALAGQEVCFVETLEEVPVGTEVLVPFINQPIEAEFLAGQPALRFLALRSSAWDHVSLAACRERGIRVANVPEFSDVTCAEHTFALILALSRRLREVMGSAQDAVRHARFSYEDARGFELAGKTLGIIGMGHIGRRVARLALAFGMEARAYDPIAMPAAEAALNDFRWASLEELLHTAHIITLHVRLSPLTRHLLNARTLALCQEGVLIINTARGGLIDTEALQAALDSGQVGGAGLDVLEEEQVLRHTPAQIISAQIVEHLREQSGAGERPATERLRDLQNIVRSGHLLTRRNVVFTPHVAFNSVESIDRLYTVLLENLRAYFAGAPINLVEEA